MDLERIAGGTRVFIDATVFVYHFTGLSVSCRRLLERVESNEVEGLTSVTALAEATHRLLMVEAVRSGLVVPGSVASKLRAKPEILKGLRIANAQIARVPLMGVGMVAVDVRTLSHAREIREKYGLMVNDSLIAAAALDSRVTAIATADLDFARVDELEVFQPGDLADEPA